MRSHLFVLALTFILTTGPVLAETAPQDRVLAYMTLGQGAAVSVIDTNSNQVVTAIPVGPHPFGVAAHGPSSRVYVGDFADDTVRVIDAETNSVIAAIPVGRGPRGVAVNRNGTRVFVADKDSDSLSVIKTASHQVVERIRFQPGAKPHGVAVHPHDSRLFVGHAGTPDAIVVIDTRRNRIRHTIPLPDGVNVQGLAVSPDGKRLYAAFAAVSYAAAIDLSDYTIAAQIPMDAGSHGVAVHPSGSPVYVTSYFGGTIAVVDTETFERLANTAAGYPFGVDVTPDGSRVYVADDHYTSSEVYVMETAGNTVVDFITVGNRPVGFGRFILGPPANPDDEDEDDDEGDD